MLSTVGKLTAAAIIIVAFIWLGPMCASLPAPGALPMPVAAALPEPAVAVATAAISAPVAAPVPEPAAKPAPAGPAVVVIAYRMKKMFPVADGHGRVSVLVKNMSDKAASDLRLKMDVRRQGKVVETDAVNTAFTLDAGSAAYRGLLVSAGALDALLAVPTEDGTELSWSLTYRLEGDAPESKRCYGLRALPRTREPEGIVWTPLGTTLSCPK